MTQCDGNFFFNKCLMLDNGHVFAQTYFNVCLFLAGNKTHRLHIRLVSDYTFGWSVTTHSAGQ